ncbi:hypothetical protein [Novosphingobium album (ex Liu et al. 2023)]|uniref:Uncharacterized protein n=1 Tax=Novosphingobium album (ex Liu et al. 2023) TaxID=3031130 RepID=A0ABT5WQ29_9SPHN|nr:hypothetical protein [Novosphingobium album (ex Liu et al. 2023)]MDE8652150.1 hypothetical protein [Novosphingobium album (ex Liu et al. 2023)]
MDLILSRTRIAGTASLYSYRALIPLDDLAPARRHRVAILQASTPAGRLPCARIADVLAPDRWFGREFAVPCGLAAGINLMARRIEALALGFAYPEMTARLTPPTLRLDHDPGDACRRIAVIDLNAAFDALMPHIATLAAADLELDRGHERRAA